MLNALHGIKKWASWQRKKTDEKYSVDITLYDIYDFQKILYTLDEYLDFPLIFVNNQIDKAEAAGYLENYEITVQIKEEILITEAHE